MHQHRAGQTATPAFTRVSTPIATRVIEETKGVTPTNLRQIIAANATSNPAPVILAPPSSTIDFNWITVSVGAGLGLIGAFFLVPVIQKALAPAAKAAV